MRAKERGRRKLKMVRGEDRLMLRELELREGEDSRE